MWIARFLHGALLSPRRLGLVLALMRSFPEIGRFAITSTRGAVPHSPIEGER
jgi:hypothetical protein